MELETNSTHVGTSRPRLSRGALLRKITGAREIAPLFFFFATTNLSFRAVESRNLLSDCAYRITRPSKHSRSLHARLDWARQSNHLVGMTRRPSSQSAKIHAAPT